MGEKLGCYANTGCECRGCGGWFISVGAKQVEKMAGIYEVGPDGELVKKSNKEVFPLCKPIMDQVARILHAQGDE